MSLSTLKMAVATLGFATVFAQNGRPGGLGRGRRLLDGQDIQVTKIFGCFDPPTSTVTFEMVWAPGQCQPLSGSNPNDEYMKVGCSDSLEDDAIVNEVFDNPSCTGAAIRTGIWTPGQKSGPNGISLAHVLDNPNGPQGCEELVFPPFVVDECRRTEPKIKISKQVGCLEVGPFTTMNFYPIWSPGLCQVQPSSDYEGGQWDGQSFQANTANRMVMECSEDPTDELVVIKAYDGVDNCDGEPNRVTYYRPGFREVSQDFDVLQDVGLQMCSAFVSTIWTFPQHVIDACAPAQPEGPLLHVSEIKGCQGNRSVVKPIIWAPGQCQRSPWDETKSITIECDPEKDMGVHMHTYRRLDCTMQQSDYTIVHNEKFAIYTDVFQGGGSAIIGDNLHSNTVAVDGCRRFQWHTDIRAACRLPTAAPTAEPTPAPTLEPTTVCEGVEKLSRRRKHKQLCRQYEQGPAGACEGAECRYNERRNKCQAVRENQISCLDVSAEHCCKFAGCFVNVPGVCVGNFEGYGN